jgi:hypothetical protein
MSQFKYTEAQLAALVAKGAVIQDHGVRLPEACPEPLATRMAWSEKKFQAEVEALAKENGWLCYHTWLSIRSTAGFPDLVMVRGNRVVWAELKKQKSKKPGPEQLAWRDALRGAGQEWFLWKPADWESIVDNLTRPQ